MSQGGSFRDLGRVGYSPRAAANILSQPQLLNQGYKIIYDDLKDRYHLAGHSNDYYFERKCLSNGDKSSHYTCELANVLVNTVEDNMRRYTKREVVEAKAARETFTNRLSYMPSSTAIAMINKGVMNCPVTSTAIRNADAIFGPSIPALKGKTQKKASLAAGSISCTACHSG